MMRNCHLARMLLTRAIRDMSGEHCPGGGWQSERGATLCGGVLCPACGGPARPPAAPEEEYARAAGALTHILCLVASKAELKSTLCYALEISGRDWAACLDKRQVWCSARTAWLAGVLAGTGSTLRYLPPLLVHALRSGASMYQPLNVPTVGAQAFPMDGIGRLDHNSPRGPSADWRVLTTADAAGTNGLTCLPKHRGTRDRFFFWSPIQ
ncbi:hypothetical protein evm_012877 [Chilo suppressalis]|nr:hypothetical protein evm_012877 [Chilo suppressalis]